MPADPGFAEGLTAGIIALYAAAEEHLLQQLAATLGSGIERPGWAEEKLHQLNLARRQRERYIARLNVDVVGQTEKTVSMAYNRGRAAGVAELASHDLSTGVFPAAQERAVALLAAELRGALAPMGQRITRAVDDVYRQTVATASATVVTGAQTRRQAAQQVLNDFARNGITGFVDRAGRSWNLTSYAEMATRTTAGHAAVQGHVDTLAANGQDLVWVDDVPRECPLCRPYEARVLSISGSTVGVIQQAAATGGPPVRVNVMTSLAEARAAGFQHPNCTHSLSLYVPGATRRPTRTADAEGYEAKQRQRAIERHVREWKRRQAVALDEPARRKAGAKVRQWQAEARRNVAETGTKRLAVREQITAAR